MQATLSHYRILEQIGAGGMGVVYRAHDEGTLDRDVAVKVLPSGALADEAARRRFRKEATALSKLNHPNIATVFDFGSENGTDFLVEELIPGLSLGEMLISGPLPEREIVNLGAQLAEGLAAAHEQGVIHRDLKPGNIRVTPDGRLKILDFGLAKVLHTAASGSDTDATASLTETQAVSGTLPYMAPEQLLNEKLEARTDIWAAGCVLYEMATGQRPFLGSGPALTDAVLHRQPARPSKLNHKVNPGLEAIVLKCLEKDPTLRYASARDIAVDLHRLGTGTVTRALAARRRTRALKVGGVLALLVVAVAVGWWSWKGRYRPMTRKAVAVLYVQNLSQDPSLDWLNSGITELLTTNLAQVKGIDVLSSEELADFVTRAGYKDRAQLTSSVAADIARAAHMDAFITGTLIKLDAARLRVDVRTQDTGTGRILLATHAESDSGNGLFKLVDGITAEIATSLVRREQFVVKPPEVEEVATANIEAYRHFRAGVDLHDRGLVKEAMQELREAIRLDPDFALAHEALWSAMLSGGQPTPTEREAEQRKVELLQWKLPRWAQLRYQVNVATLGGDEDAAVQILETAVREFPRNVDHRTSLALFLEPTGNYARIVAVLKEGLALFPDDTRLLRELAYAQARFGELDDALKTSDRLVTLHPSDPDPLQVRAIVLSASKRPDDAIGALRKARDLKPDETNIPVFMAAIYADTGRPELAETIVQEIAPGIEPFRRSSVTFSIQGHVLQARADFAGASAFTRQAVLDAKSRGRLSSAAFRLSCLTRMSFLLGDREAAAALVFARQQELQGLQFRAVADLEAALGRDADAEAALKKFAESQPQLSTAAIARLRSVNRAMAALHRKDGAEAVAALRDVRWTVASPTPFVVPETWLAFLRARGFVLMGDYSAAERQLRIALRRGYDLVLADRTVLAETLSHFYLGQVYEGTGRRDQAVSEYRLFLDSLAHSRPPLPQIEEARAALKRLGG